MFAAIAQRIVSDPSLVQKVNGVLHFKIEAGSESRSWTLDLKNGNGSVAPSAPEQADLTVYALFFFCFLFFFFIVFALPYLGHSMVQDQDFVDLLSGKLPGQQALAQGKLKMQGDMTLAQKFSRLVSTAVSTVDDVAPKDAPATSPSPKEEAKDAPEPIAKQDIAAASPPKEKANEAPSEPVAQQDAPAASAPKEAISTLSVQPSKVESSEPELHDLPAALSAQSVDDDPCGGKLASRISSVSIEERKDSGSLAVPSEHPSPANPREGSTSASVTKDEESLAAEEPLEESF